MKYFISAVATNAVSVSIASSQVSVDGSYGVFKVISPIEAEVFGDITEGVLEDFETVMDDDPSIQQLEPIYARGSDTGAYEIDGVETDECVKLCRKIYWHRIQTFLPKGGLVASGGTDLLAVGFAASYSGDAEQPEREPHAGTCIVVHAWGGGWDRNDEGSAWGIQTQRSHLAQEKYLQYYEDVDVAADFYWFAIESAKAGDMRYTNTEMFSEYLAR